MELVLAPAPITKKKRILVVDDEPHIVKLVSLSLGKKKYDILSAYSGQEALRHIKNAPPDLVVLDIMMPGINGYEMCQALRENASTKNVPIIILSAKSQMEDKLHAIDVGADDYLCKPFDPAELSRRIRLNLTLTS
jgi:two-component system, OmpR family, alkaline phosphatase synthesis response regulator PhoP